MLCGTKINFFLFFIFLLSFILLYNSIIFMEKVNGLLLKNIFTKFYEKKKITNFLIVFIFLIKVVSKLS